MDDLKKQAEELGLSIDGRWSDKRIQEEIDKALSTEAKPVTEKKFFPVRLLKNYRPIGEFVIEDEGEHRKPNGGEIEKMKAGSCILLPIDEARAIIEKKIGDRNDAIA